MFLIALGTSSTGKVGRCRARKKAVRSKFESCLTEKLSREADHHGDDARIEDGPAFFRRMDTQDFVLAEGHTLPTRATAPPRKRLPADADRTLRSLEFTGLIVRRVTRAKAVAVEYSLTKLGGTIIASLGGMCRWAKRYHRTVSADVHLPEAYEVR